MLTEFFFKNKFETKKALNVIRWTIILYTLATYPFYLIGMILNPDEYAFIHRATGPYAWAYWLLFLSALIFPLTLLIQKLASRFWFVLFVAFIMKAGVYFERFVIITTRFHRDYLTGNGDIELTDLFTFGLGMQFLQGAIIAVLILYYHHYF
ncbi:hypothetical protein [Hanstruepera marina]|uniref:hypothetical protein n=1 Tax=Hanstruepera marina TaxID=2873265 RepID=UPI001CA6BCA4|nr:hypothetical protein [Hanstruepera marina]